VVSIRKAKMTTTLSRIIHHGWLLKLASVTVGVIAGAARVIPDS
jgi:hypothetical protein